MSNLISPVRVGPAKDVFFLHDGKPFAKTAARMLAMDFRIATHNLNVEPAPNHALAQVLVCCFSRIKPKHLPVIRTLASRFGTPPIILLSVQPRDGLMLSDKLPGTVYLFEPLKLVELKETVKQGLDAAVEAAWSKLQPQNREVLKASLKSFQSCFGASARGEPLPVEQVYEACHAVRDSFASGSSPGEWLSALQMHHDRTYRHSMMVCGSLTYFCRELGVRGTDLERATIAGFLHDIGKSRVPTEILDKTGELSSAESDAMDLHPTYSREILLTETGLDPSVLEVAFQHHERLDGTGYPDRLTGDRISDLVRLTTIADVFAIHTEGNGAQPGLTPEKALEVMGKTRGCIDMALFHHFREFVLDGQKDAEAA